MDQADINLDNIVFDSKNHERPPWKFFGKQIPRSEIVFMVQVFMIFLVFITASINITLNYEKVDLTSFWTGLLGASVGSLLPHPKL